LHTDSQVQILQWQSKHNSSKEMFVMCLYRHCVFTADRYPVQIITHFSNIQSPSNILQGYTVRISAELSFTVLPEYFQSNGAQFSSSKSLFNFYNPLPIHSRLLPM